MDRLLQKCIKSTAYIYASIFNRNTNADHLHTTKSYGSSSVGPDDGTELTADNTANALGLGEIGAETKVTFVGKQAVPCSLENGMKIRSDECVDESGSHIEAECGEKATATFRWDDDGKVNRDGLIEHRRLERIVDGEKSSFQVGDVILLKTPEGVDEIYVARIDCMWQKPEQPESKYGAGMVIRCQWYYPVSIGEICAHVGSF